MEEFCSNKLTEEELTEEARDIMTVGVVLLDLSRFSGPLLLFDLSSDAMRAARTSGARESHMSVMDLGTVGESLTMYSSLFDSSVDTPNELTL